MASASTQSTSTPHRCARPRALASEAGEKSTPVTRAPRRASEIVSKPMWHWTWRTSRSRTSPTAARTARPSSSVSESLPATSASVSYTASWPWTAASAIERAGVACVAGLHEGQSSAGRSRRVTSTTSTATGCRRRGVSSTSRERSTRSVTGPRCSASIARRVREAPGPPAGAASTPGRTLRRWSTSMRVTVARARHGARRGARGHGHGPPDRRDRSGARTHAPYARRRAGTTRARRRGSGRDRLRTAARQPVPSREAISGSPPWSSHVDRTLRPCRLHRSTSTSPRSSLGATSCGAPAGERWTNRACAVCSPRQTIRASGCW